MEDRLARVEAALSGLQHAVDRLERRVAALEGSPSPLPDEAVVLPAAKPADYDVVAVLSFAGRSCVALGGAYLLRALTDAGVLNVRLGIACGLAYAMTWLAFADSAGRRGRGLSAGFHALVMSMIGFPVLWESVTRFTLLTPAAAAVVITVMTAAALAVAGRQRLQSIAWIVVIAAVITSLMMIAATGAVLSFAAFLIGLGVATLWLGYDPFRWKLLRWPVAVVADVSVVTLAMRASTEGWSDPPLAVIAVQLLLLTAYLASVVIRTLIRGRDVIPFELIQTIVSLGAGFGGALFVASVTGGGRGVLAAINLIVGVGCYGVAFAFVARRQGLGHNFYFYTSLAIVLVLVSTSLMLPRAPASVTFAALGLLSAWMAWRIGHLALMLHAAIYIAAAANAAHLLSAATFALLAPASAAWPPFTAVSMLVLAATFLCWLIPMPPRADAWGGFARLPRLFITVVLAWAVCGWMAALLTPLLARTSGQELDPGIVATIRTTVVGGAALALAQLGRMPRFKESAQLVYPVLVAGGIKLAAEDLRYSRPATLFVALAFYGSALILAPRLLRGSSARIPG